MMSDECGVMNERQLEPSHSSLRTHHSSFLPSLADDRDDGLRVLGRDALILAQGVAQVLRGRLPQVRFEFGRPVDRKERALGRLVVDAVEAVEAEATGPGVRGL